jgi:gliding motility-associated-like protein
MFLAKAILHNRKGTYIHKIWMFAIALLYVVYGISQECPTPVLTNPLNGAVNVPVDTNISWTPVVGVTSYLIAIGTFPGGDDIISERNIGSAPTYTPTLGLPENTDIYVTISLFFFQGGISTIICGPETFRTENVTTIPPCTTLNSPVDGEVEVNPATNISWDYAPTATGYVLSIGTTPGGSELLNNADQGNILSHNPVPELDPNTTIYVRVVPYNAIGQAVPCEEESFTTSAVAALPGCTNLVNPVDLETNVPLTPRLEWTAVPGATGYRVTIGNSPTSNEVLDNTNFFTNSTFIIELEANKTFFVTIIPFNEAGDAIGCEQESFSTLLGCGPFFDPATGELITLNPEIDFPTTISLCENELPLTYTAPDTAEGFRWYKIDLSGNESIISTMEDVLINEEGLYRYEAYNTIIQPGGFVECESSQIFEVVTSEIATISSIDITEQANTIRITVNATGIGDYEYALDDINGPYQNSNTFNNIAFGSHTIYVRDTYGCGIAEERIVQDLTLEGFPKFFSPNGDGINDFWQFIPPPISGDVALELIQVYNRYGQFLVQIDPSSLGWDGTINGSPLPASDYWFKAIDTSNNELTGHFSLKR